MNLKKLALIFLFIGIAAGAAYLLYRLFFTAPVGAPTPAAPGVTTPGQGLPSAGTGRPTQPTETGGGIQPSPAVVPPAATVAAGGPTQVQSVATGVNTAPIMTASGLNFYNADEGRFYHQTADGKLVAMTDKTFPQASNVQWSPDASKALIEFPDNSKIIYNFATQRQVTLPSHWQDFGWTNNGSTLVAKSIGVDENNRWLITLNADGSGAKLVEPLGNNADKVTVQPSQDGQIIAFSQTGDAAGFDTRQVIPIGQNQENFKALNVEGFGFEPIWTPDGQSLIYSAASGQDNYQPSLWFVNAKGDAIGGNRTDLHVRTWADKCNFATATVLYCAVPDDLPGGAGLERGVADGVPDSIVKIDLLSGSQTAVGRPPTDTTIKQLSVSPDQSTLSYVDSAGNLSQMKLK